MFNLNYPLAALVILITSLKFLLRYLIIAGTNPEAKEDAWRVCGRNKTFDIPTGITSSFSTASNVGVET